MSSKDLISSVYQNTLKKKKNPEQEVQYAEPDKEKTDYFTDSPSPSPSRQNMTGTDISNGSRMKSLEFDADQATQQVGRDIKGYQDITAQHQAAHDAPIQKVSAWKRALFGAMQGLSRANPNSDWGTIIGSAAGGGAVDAASTSTYERQVKGKRDAQIEADYGEREQSHLKRTDMDAKLAELSRHRLSDAIGAEDRVSNREIKRDDQKLRKQQIDLNDIYKNSALAEQKRQHDLQDSRGKEGLQLRAKELEQRDKIAQARLKISSASLAERVRADMAREARARDEATYSVSIPVMVDGEEKMQNFDVPVSKNAIDYFQDVYGAESNVGKAAGKNLNPNQTSPLQTRKTTPTSPAAKEANKSNTFSSSFLQKR